MRPARLARVICSDSSALPLPCHCGPTSTRRWIEVRERLGRDWDVEGAADRRPAVLRPPLDKSLGWDSRSDVRVVPLVRRHRRRCVVPPLSDAIPQELVEERQPVSVLGELVLAPDSEDGLVGAPPPRGRVVALRKQDDRIGIRLGELRPEGGCRPVHRGDVAGEELVPVGHVPAQRLPPDRHVVEVLEHLVHVIAAPPEELLERERERPRPSPRKPGADQEERHSAGPETAPSRGAKSSGQCRNALRTGIGAAWPRPQIEVTAIASSHSSTWPRVIGARPCSSSSAT